MDDTCPDLDSFTADMYRRVKIHKKILDELTLGDQDIVEQEDNENDGKDVISETEEEDKEHESNFDELLMNDNYKAHVRKSISALLNIHKSVLPSSDEETEPAPNDKPASRLNKRLNKLAEHYNDSDGVPSVLTENKSNINKEIPGDKDNKAVPLKARLNNIARFYYPIQNDETSKEVAPVKPSQNNQHKPIEKLSVVSAVQTDAKPSQITQVVKSDEAKPSCPIPIMKQTSVANLKKMFEKAPEDSEKKEAAPELLSIRDKKRLFEKAIKDESEASKSQYRKLPQPPKRVSNWEPIPHEECATKKQKSIIFEKENPTKVPANNEIDHHSTEMTSDGAVPEENEITHVSNIDNHASAVSLSELLNCPEALASEVNAIETNNPESNDQESVEKAFETIDNYNLSYSDEPNEIATIADITFSALDSNDQLQRSSTKVDLKSDSQSSDASHPSSFENPPEKPARLYLDDNDKPGGNVDESEDVPQIRTISFYRRQQKLQKEACNSPAPGPSCPTNVIHLNQNIQEDQSTKLDEFKRDCNEHIAALKQEILEHNRISGQASTALNMCLTMVSQTQVHHDMGFNEGRIEAERLLLTASEKRKACTSEINRFRNMLKNPDKHAWRLSNVSSKGMVTISNVRIPLRNEFVDSRAKGKVTSTFHFICLITNGPNVFVSELLDSSKNHGCDHLNFSPLDLKCQGLNEDFKIRVELFALELNKDKSKKETIGRSFRIKFGTSSLKRMEKGSVNSPIPDKITGQQSSFKPVGQILLNLATVRKPPSFYRMEGAPLNSPVDGYVIMDYSLKVSHNFSSEGYFDLQDAKSSFWNHRYFVLQGSQLMYWKFPSDVKDKEPLGVINLKHCINPAFGFLKSEQRKVCMRPNTFALVSIKPPTVSNAHKLVNGGTIVRSIPEKVFISSNSKEVSQLFCQQIGNVIRNIRVWEEDAVRPYSAEEFNRLLLSDHL